MKITLLGDSIRLIGYGKEVERLLGEDFEVFQPKDNCRFAKYTLRGLYDWKKDMEGSEIVHFNVGLWDTCDIFGDGAFTEKDEYINNVVRIAKILKERYKKVIFATTTPANEKNPHHDNKRIAEYNLAAREALLPLGVQINDLFALVSQDIERYICDDLIHLSEDGIALCAKAVVDAIKKAAAE